MNFLNILKSESNNYTQVKAVEDPLINGKNLLEAYKKVRQEVLNNQNRFTIFLEPAEYHLNTSSLLLTKSYVDIIGLDGNSKSIINSTIQTPSNGTIYQLVDDIRLSNLKIMNSNLSYSYPWFVDQGLLSQVEIGIFEQGLGEVPSVYFRNVPNGANNGDTTMKDVEFVSLNMSIPTMRIGVSYQGTYTNCKAGNWAFGFKGRANGKYYNCEAGYFSFGSFGITAGYFEGCKGGAYSFGSDGLNVSAKFIRCNGGLNSFGWNATFNTSEAIDCKIDGE